MNNKPQKNPYAQNGYGKITAINRPADPKGSLIRGKAGRDLRSGK